LETISLKKVTSGTIELFSTFEAISVVSPSNRYFTMGNALVVDLVKEISEQILYLGNLENKTNYFKSDKKVEKVIHN
jgi:hypothetical protein